MCFLFKIRQSRKSLGKVITSVSVLLIQMLFFSLPYMCQADTAQPKYKATVPKRILRSTGNLSHSRFLLYGHHGSKCFRYNRSGPHIPVPDIQRNQWYTNSTVYSKSPFKASLLLFSGHHTVFLGNCILLRLYL